MHAPAPIIVYRAEVRLLELALVEPFVAAHGTTTVRRLTVVRLDTSVGDGWGECAALPSPTYTDETADGAFSWLGRNRATLSPMMGTLVTVGADLRPRLTGGFDNPMAAAAVEMAVLDAALGADGHSLADYLGADLDTVTAGVAVGLGDPATTARRVGELAAEGYQRVKLKIAPGRIPTDAITAATEAGIEVQVDANGTFGPDGVGELAELADRFALSAFEQPFAPDDPASAAALVSALDRAGLACAVVGDESVGSVDDARRLAAAGALTGISVKPSRVGGLAAALELVDLADDEGLALTAGGMVESGLGRHLLAALAAMDGFTLGGDVSPAARWIVEDPWDDLVLGPDGVTVPSGPGIVAGPDRERLHRLTREIRVIE